MASKKITGKDLKSIGFVEGKALGTAIHVAEASYKGKSLKFKLDLFKRVLEAPAFYKNHKLLAPLAEALISVQEKKHIELKEKIPYKIYGVEGIQESAIHQMEQAMKLPVAKYGALMPDAHHGYGLPIGGVLATENAVIPYGVGMDIGCRMCLSIFDLPVDFQSKKIDYKKLLVDNTKFGRETFRRPKDHAVLDRKEFNDVNFLIDLKDKAWSQIGTSGGGNHFVEFGVVDLQEVPDGWDIPEGRYLGLLSHSGSRGLGGKIAGHYTKLAKERCKLPGEAQHLAWLDLSTEAGQEYWIAMTLAGDYASACHHQIHDRIAADLGVKPLNMVENHHNFAWKEYDQEGSEIIVHRKGATPAGEGVLGIIPGSMIAPGFIVRGKGVVDSVQSASHGAGRVLSRTKAKMELSKSEVKRVLKKAGVEVIGSGLDEAPMVYKDIHKVMSYQQDLVDTLGSFTPKVIRMCGSEKFVEGA